MGARLPWYGCGHNVGYPVFEGAYPGDVDVVPKIHLKLPRS